MFSELQSSTTVSDYPYSEGLKRLLEFGASIKINPIYVIGLTQSELHSMRNAYSNPDSRIRVGIYGIYDVTALADRIGIEPTVVVLAEHIRIDGVVAEFIRKYRVPVLRLQANPVHISDLCHEDYYAPVYETMDSKKITDSEEVTYMLNLGILVWLHTHGKVDKDCKDISKAEERVIDPRASNIARKAVKPEPSWEAYANKQMIGFVPSASYEESMKTIDSALTFRNTDSSFELNLDT